MKLAVPKTGSDWPQAHLSLTFLLRNNALRKVVRSGATKSYAKVLVFIEI